MAKNQSTYTLHIDAELGNLQRTLSTAKNALASFMQSENAPKGLEKAFEKINDLLGQISDKTGKPLDLKGLTGAGKDLNTVQENFRAIVRLLGEFDDLSDDVKLTFLSVEEQKKVTAITEALKNYGIAAENSAKKIKELENAQKNLTKNEGQLNRAKKNVGGLETKKASKEAVLEGARGKLVAAQASGAGPEKIAGYQAKVTQLEADLGSLNRQLAEANEELLKAQNAYNNAANAVSTLGKEAKQASLDALHGLKEEAKKLGISLEGLNGHDAAAQIEILKRRLSEFKSEAMKGAKPAFDAIKEGCEKAEDAVESLGEGVKAGTEAVKEMDEAAAQRDAFEAKIKSFLGLSGAAQVLRAALRDALQTITELDATMTQMAVVTDLTVGDYWDQLPEYSQRASELGVSINDAYKAATLYYQQGLKTNEVNAISAETLKLAKVAGIDAAEATNKMTAALRGFNMELNEASAQKVADVYAELAAITAADVNEISTAMTKTASIASSAGMEFETTAAFLSQIIETTRESAETAGTAMKTVIARFQELKKDPSEIGEVDGEIVDANAIETALRSVGVSLRDAQGQFRELDDVFLELSSKWDSLDTNTQRYIATIAAGSRQQSRFIAMMQDYSRTQELVVAANSSAGASQKQFEKTLDSIEVKTEKLKNAWHEFTMGISNSDLVKNGIDILTKFLEIINKATNGLGDKGLGGALMKIVSVFAIFKMGMKIFNKFETPIMSLFKKVTKWAGIEGFKSGKAYTEAAKKGAEAAASDEEASVKTRSEKNPHDEPKTTLKDKFAQTGRGWHNLTDDGGVVKKTRAELTEMGKSPNGGLKQRKQRVQTAKTIRDARAKNLGKSNSLTAEADAELAAAEKSLAEYQDKQEELRKASKKAWDDIGAGIGAAGETLTGVGLGLTTIGGFLSSTGIKELEGFGEALSTIGTVITFIGTALSAIPPILTLISSHPIIAIIVIFLGVVLAAVTAIVKAIQDASPEGKLKKAQEAAERASKAADQAADSYENLRTSIEGLGDQYKTLEKLTKGTKEWNEAIEGINNSVLDLIEKYPELAQYVMQKDGYLSIDINSDEVQEVLKRAKTSAILSKNISALSSASVAQAEVAVQKKNYGLSGDVEEISKQIAKGELIIVDGKFSAGLETIEGLGYTQEQLDEFYEANQDVIDGLRDYGSDLLAAEASFNAAYSAMALSVQQLVDTSSFTTKEASVISNLVNEKTVSQKYQSSLESISDIDYTKDSLPEEVKKERDDAIKEVYGSGAKVEDYSNEQIQAAVAQSRGMQSAVDLAGMIPMVLREFRGKNSDATADMLINLLADDEGKQITLKDYNSLISLNEKDLKKIYADLGRVGEEIFGSEQKFLNSINKTRVIVDKQNSSMKASMVKIFGENSQLPEWNLPAELGSELLSKFALIFERADPESFQGFYASFDALMSKVSEEQQGVLASIIESTNLGDTTQLAELPKKLEEAGLGYAVLGNEIYDFVKYAKEATQAIARLSSEELGQVLTDIEKVINNINKGEQGRIFEETQYKSLLATDPTLQKEFVKVADGYMYLGNHMDDLREAVLDNTKALRGDQDITEEDSRLAVDFIANTNKYMDSLIAKGAVYSETYTEWYQADADREKYQREYDAALAAIQNTDLGTYLAGIGMEADTDTFLGALADFSLPFFGDVIGAFTGGGTQEYAELVQNLEAAEHRLNSIKKKKQKVDALSGDEKYKNYSENIDSMTEDQLITYFENLSSQLAQAGLDMGAFDIEGLTSKVNFSQTGELVLKDWYKKLQEIMLDPEEFITRERENHNIDIGNSIYSISLSGSSGLYEWYNSQNGYEETGYSGSEIDDNILKGVMLKLGQQYGLSENFMATHFNSEGKMITEKFDKFIDLIADYEKEERNRPAKDKTIDLINQVKDALIESRQKEIDTLAEKFDAIAEANNKMVDSLQELVNIDRQRRENEKTEQDISDKYNQLAYSGMDSSGSSILEKLALQEEIKQAEQDYQDTLVDQAIQQLQDANQKAEEQRERQISLMQAQLDLWANSEQIWGEVNAIVVNAQSAMNNSGSYDNTELADLLSGISGNLSEEEKEDFARDIVRLLQGYTDYHAGTQYASGGLANFTGPAWLDGTPSKPEYVLNAAQTERFFYLVDILEGIDTKSTDKNVSGDNYFDISINVDKLENDYDVEQVADKIRRMIYEDATYRNVNAISHIR